MKGDDERAGAVFAALADPTRRSVLALLADHGPTTATELAEALPVSRQAIAKHLTILDRAGLVGSEHAGREHRFAVATDGLADAAAWLEATGQAWDARIARLQQALASRPDPGRDRR